MRAIHMPCAGGVAALGSRQINNDKANTPPRDGRAVPERKKGERNENQTFPACDRRHRGGGLAAIGGRLIACASSSRGKARRPGHLRRGGQYGRRGGHRQEGGID